MGLLSGAKKVIDFPAKKERLDFMGAIEAHMRWKIRLQAYINGTSDEQLKADTVGRDDKCVLGEWIHGPGGAAYGSDPMFEELRQKHATFHQCAKTVIDKVDAGDQDLAMQILTEGDYLKHSQNIKTMLARLSRSIKG